MKDVHGNFRDEDYGGGERDSLAHEPDECERERESNEQPDGAADDEQHDRSRHTAIQRPRVVGSQ
jgi:hypothetical protein